MSPVDAGDYALGIAGLATILVALTIAAVALRRALIPAWEGAPAFLADAILGIGLFVLIAELLGVVGLLTGLALVIASLLAGALPLAIGGERGLGFALRRSRGRTGAVEDRQNGVSRSETAPGRPPQRVSRPEAVLGRPDGGWQVAIAAAISLLVIAQWAVPTQLAVDRGIYGGDSLWYHMPFAAGFAQEGSITSLHFIDPLYLNWFYPQNSELLHAAGLLLVGNDFLSPLINLGWLALALLAAWCCGRPYGAGAVSLAGVAILLSADLFFSRQPGNANNDVVAIALLLAGVAILLNARSWEAGAVGNRRGRTGAAEGRKNGVSRPEAVSGRPLAAGSPLAGLSAGALVVAGLAAGLAAGTKLTVLVPVAALTLGIIAIAKRGERTGAALAWGAGLLAGGGFWYLRNLIVAGNPLPWMKLGIGPVALPRSEELQGRDQFSVLHYATDSDVWREFFRPGLEERFGDLWPAVLALAAIGIVYALVRGGRNERLIAAVAAIAAIAYAVTPLSASGPEGQPFGFRLNIRYLAPALALGLVLLAPAVAALARDRERGRWALVATALLAAVLLVTADPLDPLDSGRGPEAILVAAVAGVALAIALLARRGVPRVALAAGGAIVAVAVAAAGWPQERDYEKARYSTAAPDFPAPDEHPGDVLAQGLGSAYDWARDVRDAKIALGGTQGAFFGYGLYGPDSSNDVELVAERGPRGALFVIEDCRQWRSAVNDGGYDYVVTTPDYDQDHPERPLPAPERRWVGSDRAATRIAGEGAVAVFRLTGELDPLTCPVGRPRTRSRAAAL